MNTSISKSIVTEPPVWFITGCSTGFGLELAKQAIGHGYRTVVTARDPSKLEGYGATDKVLVLKLDGSANESKNQIDDYVATAGNARASVRASFRPSAGRPRPCRQGHPQGGGPRRRLSGGPTQGGGMKSSAPGRRRAKGHQPSATSANNWAAVNVNATLASSTASPRANGCNTHKPSAPLR